MKRRDVALVVVALLALLGVLLLLDEDGTSGSVAVLSPGKETADGSDSRSDREAPPESVAGPVAAPLAEVPAPAPHAAEPLAAVAQIATVRGRVTDAAGAPLAGARVTRPWKSKGADEPPSAETDADGRYVLVVPAGKGGFMDVQAESAAHASAQTIVHITSEGTLPPSVDFSLDALVQMTGRVLWAQDEAVCVDAHVVVTPIRPRNAGFAPPRPPLCDTTTDADGNFRAELPGWRIVSVAVTPPADLAAKGATQLTHHQFVSLPASGDEQVELRLRRPATVTVVLRGAAASGFVTTVSASLASATATATAPATASAPAAAPRPFTVMLVPHDLTNRDWEQQDVSAPGHR